MSDVKNDIEIYNETIAEIKDWMSSNKHLKSRIKSAWNDILSISTLQSQGIIGEDAWRVLIRRVKYYNSIAKRVEYHGDNGVHAYISARHDLRFFMQGLKHLQNSKPSS